MKQALTRDKEGQKEMEMQLNMGNCLEQEMEMKVRISDCLPCLPDDPRDPTGIFNILMVTGGNDDSDVARIKYDLLNRPPGVYISADIFKVNEFSYIHNNLAFLKSQPTTCILLDRLKVYYNASCVYRIDNTVYGRLEWIQLYIHVLEGTCVVGILRWNSFSEKMVHWMGPQSCLNYAREIEDLCHQVHQTEKERYHTMSRQLFDIPCLFDDVVSVILPYLFVE